jgi:hypothetical protein
MELRRYRPLALFLLVLHLTGCYSWQPATVSPRQFIEEEQPGQIRIVQADGERMELRNPRIESDSLTARIFSRLRTGTVRIALADITAVESRRLQVGKTVLAMVPLYLPVALILGRRSACSAPPGSRC